MSRFPVRAFIAFIDLFLKQGFLVEKEKNASKHDVIGVDDSANP